jgi:hypothetical protein
MFTSYTLVAGLISDTLVDAFVSAHLLCLFVALNFRMLGNWNEE